MGRLYDGEVVGDAVGAPVGAEVGAAVGAPVGDAVGSAVGAAVGACDVRKGEGEGGSEISVISRKIDDKFIFQKMFCYHYKI